jgi:hypothetical protein
VLGAQAETVKDEVNPVANPTLHARAERAAVGAYLAATATTGARRMQLMDRAAAGVFKAAGTPRDVAAFYAVAVTALVLERLRNAERVAGWHSEGAPK